MSLVPGRVDFNVALECHLCCSPPLSTKEVSSLDGSWGLCASRLNWKKEKRKVVNISLSVPLDKGDRVRAGFGICRLVCNVLIVFMFTYGWWYCFGREYLYDFDLDCVPDPLRATRITPESIRIVSKQLMFFDLPGLSLSTTRGFSKKLGSTGSTRICEKFFGLNRSTPIFENKI